MSKKHIAWKENYVEIVCKCTYNWRVPAMDMKKKMYCPACGRKAKVKYVD